jgi:hypothetical protein
MGAVAPKSAVPHNLQISETRILIRLLRIYFPRISELGPAAEVRGGGVEPSKPPLRTPRLGHGGDDYNTYNNENGTFRRDVMCLGGNGRRV